QTLGLRAAVAVDLDEAAIELDQLVEPDVFGVRDDADGDDAVAELALRDLAVLALDLRIDAVGAGLEVLDAGAGHDRHALLLERLFKKGGHIRILDRHDAVEHFDHGHFGAHVAVETRELDPDRAGADDQEPGRHFGWRHRMPIGPHALAVGRRERQVALPRAGRDDDMLGGERLAALLALHFELPGRGHPALAHVHGDLVLLHQVSDALVELLRHPARALHHCLKSGLYLLGNEAILLGVLHVVINLGRAQQRLGRDAPPVEADPAEQLALDDRGLEPELRRADRRDVAAGARSEDDDIVLFSHWNLRLIPLAVSLSEPRGRGASVLRQAQDERNWG